MTNISADEISELYRHRWQIEIFFKWLTTPSIINGIPFSPSSNVLPVLLLKPNSSFAALPLNNTPPIFKENEPSSILLSLIIWKAFLLRAVRKLEVCSLPCVTNTLSVVIQTTSPIDVSHESHNKSLYCHNSPSLLVMTNLLNGTS